MRRNRSMIVLLAGIIALLMVGYGFAGKKKDGKSAKAETVTIQQESIDRSESKTSTGDQSPAPIQTEIMTGQNQSGQARTGETIEKQVISCGGTDGSSTQYSLLGTVSQTATGYGSSTEYNVSHGYYQQGSGDCCQIAGDATNDGTVNVGDAVFLIEFVFKGGPAPECQNGGDANADCTINVSDAVYLINYIFKGGLPPVCGCVE